jgi:ligand-binding SRPBCC domain-containing protein
VRWITKITVWEPPFRFVDEQIKGPYRKWRHEHIFEEHPQGTRAIDSIEYLAPGGWLVEKFLVRPDVERIFAHRQRVLAEIFSRHE